MNEGMVMENTLMIRALKEKIKDLAALQVLTKKARKTSLPKEEWLALKNELAPKKAYWDHSVAASDARLRKVEITACLNYYHELRGSAFRHGDAELLKDYWYGKYMTELKAELAKVK
jgi:hypothetical protein